MSDAAPPSRREQKKAEVREALIRAADDLFVEHGYEGTTVDQIAERAGVSRRTFFRYFASKEAIAFPQAPERQQAFAALLEHHKAQLPLVPAVFEACYEIGREFRRGQDDELRRQAVIDQSPALQAAELEIYRAWESVLIAAVTPADATASRQRKGKLFAAAAIGIVRSVLREWFDAEGDRDIVELGREGFGLLQQGFGESL